MVFLVFSSVFLFKVKVEMVDFEVNYVAGQRLSLGETLYRVEDEHYQFKYSPFSALLYLPLSHLPLTVAKGLWFFLIIVSTSVLVYLSRSLLHIQNKLWLTLFPLLILARFFLRELQLGQINAFITMILMLMIWSILRENNASHHPRTIFWAGVLLGLATALKPYALIFFPYLLIKKKWKSLIYAAVFLILSLFIPSLFYGLNGNLRVLQEWISTLSRSTPHLLDSQDNISLLGCLMKWTGSQRISLFVFFGILVILSILVLLIVLKGKKRREAIVLDSSVLLILIPLVSPLGWDYTLLMSFLGVMMILAHFFDFSKFWRGMLIFNLAVIALSLFDLLGRKGYAEFMSWSVFTINFLILLAYLAFLRFKSIR